MKIKFFTGLTLLLGAFLFLFVTAAPAQAGDCDGNAIIYCGVSSTSDLTYKLNHGTGKQYQSSSELKSLFAYFHAYTSDFSHIKSGVVNKDNKVYVNGKVVATNVFTVGRHDIQPGSYRYPEFSYPVYKRHPSVSFIPDSLDAYVYLNYDGSMRYAIIKSCGNIVLGVVRNPPPVTPTGVNIRIVKFSDENGNGVQESTEPQLEGWQFRVSGNGFNQTVTTLPDGTVTLSGLRAGTYTVTEIQQDGWRNTTGMSIVRSVTSSAATQTFAFGNQQVSPPVTPPSGGGDVTTLPVTGTREWVMAGLVLVILGAILWWIRSKDMLRLAKRKKPTGKTNALKNIKRSIKNIKRKRRK